MIIGNIVVLENVNKMVIMNIFGVIWEVYGNIVGIMSLVMDWRMLMLIIVYLIIFVENMDIIVLSIGVIVMLIRIGIIVVFYGKYVIRIVVILEIMVYFIVVSIKKEELNF